MMTWDYKENMDVQEGERWLIRWEDSKHYQLRIIGNYVYDDEKKVKNINILYKNLDMKELRELRDWLNQLDIPED